MRVREWGRGGGGGGGTRARESIRRRLSGGAQDLYCDRDHVVSAGAPRAGTT